MTRARENSSQRTQKRNEAAEKYDFAAMPQIEIFCEIKLLLIDSYVVTVFHQDFATESSTDPKAKIVPQDCAERGCNDNKTNIHCVERAGVHRGSNERRLAWQGEPRTFQ